MASNGTPASPRRSARLAGQVAAAAADGDAAPARSSGPLATLLDFVLLRRPVPPSALANLKNYKYAAVDYSVLSKYVLKPYWTWLLQFMPMWLAPNMITLIGLLFILGNCGLVVAFDGYLEGTGPGWLYLRCGRSFVSFGPEGA